MIWLRNCIKKYLHFFILGYKYEYFLELLEDSKDRPIYSISKAYKKEECSKWNFSSQHEIYTTSQCYCLSECCDKTTNTIKYKPGFTDFMLEVSSKLEFCINNFSLMFFPRKYTYNFEISEGIDYAIMKSIPVLIRFSLVSMSSIAYIPNS